MYNQIMKCLIVVASYNMNEFCFNNVMSHKTLFPDYDILVVDNNSSNTEYLDKLSDCGVNVQKSVFGGAFEPGALLQAYNQYKAENYFLLQDSIEMIDANPIIEYVNSDNNFVLALQQFCPALHMCKEHQLVKLKEIDSKLRSYAAMYPGIEHSSFVAKTHHIQFLIDKNLLTEENIPRDKSGEELWERIFGLAFHCNKIDVKSLFAKIDPIYQFSGRIPIKNLFFNGIPNDKAFKKNSFGRI